MKLWLDDIRIPPDGWIWIQNVGGMIEYFEKDADAISEISLDHDLGENTETGYDFLVWMERQVAEGNFIPPFISVHSANPVGVKRMEMAIASIYRLAKE